MLRRPNPNYLQRWIVNQRKPQHARMSCRVTCVKASRGEAELLAVSHITDNINARSIRETKIEKD
jgi:hypothetical protein